MYGAIAARDAQAVIPPRKNAKLWKPPSRACWHALSDSVYARSKGERPSGPSLKYLGRALWRQLTAHHHRSRVETKMHCVKLLGQRLSARDFDRQVAEIRIRAAFLNCFTALGIPETVAVG